MKLAYIEDLSVSPTKVIGWFDSDVGYHSLPPVENLFQVTEEDWSERFVKSFYDNGALVSGPAPSGSELAAAKAEELKKACGAAIVSGKQCDALGSDHLYPTTKDDQAFLMARYSKAVALGQAGAPYKFMCADVNGVWARREHTAEQIIAVSLAVEGHITAMLNRLDALIVELALAEDDAMAIANINWQ